MSDSSQKPHGRQHITLPCPSPSPGAYSNSCPLSQWCHSTISSSVVLFSSCPKSFPASESFLMNQPFASGGASASVLPVNIQSWFSLGLTGLISLQSKGLLRVFSNTIQKHQLFSAQPSLWSNFSSVQLAQSCLTHYDNPMDCSTPGHHVHQQLPEFTQTHVHWVGDAIQPSHPLSAPSPPAFNLSQHQGLFQWVSSSHQWPKYWSFSFNISPSNEYSGLISFRMDWLNLLALQGTLKSLLQHHSSKALIL